MGGASLQQEDWVGGEAREDFPPGEGPSGAAAPAENELKGSLG